MKKCTYLIFIIFCFILVFFLYRENHARKTISYANQVLNDYIKEPNNKAFHALQELKKLTNENSNNFQVRSLYLNILLLEKQYSLGLEQIKILNRIKPLPLSKLNECILIERIGDAVGHCYQDAIALFAANNNRDDNYILALKFANDPRFEDERKRLIETGRIIQEVQEIIAMDKQTFLQTFYP